MMPRRKNLDKVMRIRHYGWVLKRLARFVVVLSLVGVLGGHWALLQSIAWVGMAIDFSHNDPLVTAIEKVFSGHHPCNLCHFVSEGKKSERAPDKVKPVSKLDFISVVEFSLPTPPQHSIELTAFFFRGDSRSDTPPSPPPRSA